MLRRLTKIAVWGLILLGCGREAHAGLAPGIYDIGLLEDDGIPRSFPRAVSPDGAIVVGSGTTNFPASSEAFSWSAGLLTGLGDLPGTSADFGADPWSFAYDVSPSGFYVVGSANSSAGTKAAAWLGGTNLIPLGDLPGGAFDSEARGVAQNGMVVGRGSSANGNEAFRFNGTSMTGLGDLPGGDFDSIATGISTDGSVIVGTGHSASGQEAFIYTNNTMTGLGDLAGGDFRSAATAVSSDGSTVVGSGTSQSGIYSEAFVWRNGVMTGLGDLPGGNQESEALAVSGDGSTIVGVSSSNQGCGSCPSAFVWDSTHGMRLLEDMLTDDYGISLGGWRLRGATAISDDGLTIAGYGSNPNLGTFSRGFVITLPEPGTLCLVSIGVMVFSKRRR